LEPVQVDLARQPYRRSFFLSALSRLSVNTQAISTGVKQAKTPNGIVKILQNLSIARKFAVK